MPELVCQQLQRYELFKSIHTHQDPSTTVPTIYLLYRILTPNMPDWKSPLIGYENAEPLPDTINPDGKSLFNPPGPRSKAYDEFPEPIDSSNNGFDFHSMFSC